MQKQCHNWLVWVGQYRQDWLKGCHRLCFLRKQACQSKSPLILHWEDFYRSPARNGWTRRMTETNCRYNNFQASFCFFLYWSENCLRERELGGKTEMREEGLKVDRMLSLQTSLSPRPLTWPCCAAQRQAPLAGKGRIDRSAALVILMTAAPALSVPIRLTEVPTQCWGDSALPPLEPLALPAGTRLACTSLKPHSQ